MSECILVADDDREIVKAIAILLEREGYKVLRAYDGLEALDLLAQNQVQLILMDVMMPRMDGLSAIMKIREKKYTHHCSQRKKRGHRQGVGTFHGSGRLCDEALQFTGIGCQGKKSSQTIYQIRGY